MLQQQLETIENKSKKTKKDLLKSLSQKLKKMQEHNELKSKELELLKINYDRINRPIKIQNNNNYEDENNYNEDYKYEE